MLFKKHNVVTTQIIVSINGYKSAFNYDLTTTVLRNVWGYKGFVMTDRWAKCNCKGEDGTKENLKALVRAQNDVYMVCDSAENKPHNILAGLNRAILFAVICGAVITVKRKLKIDEGSRISQFHIFVQMLIL